MISVKHPLEECNRIQQKLIADVAPEDRVSNELIFSYGNASYKFFYQNNQPHLSQEEFIKNEMGDRDYMLYRIVVEGKTSPID